MFKELWQQLTTRKIECDIEEYQPSAEDIAEVQSMQYHQRLASQARDFRDYCAEKYAWCPDCGTTAIIFPISGMRLQPKLMCVDFDCKCGECSCEWMMRVTPEEFGALLAWDALQRFGIMWGIGESESADSIGLVESLDQLEPDTE